MAVFTASIDDRLTDVVADDIVQAAHMALKEAGYNVRHPAGIRVSEYGGEISFLTGVGTVTRGWIVRYA